MGILRIVLSLQLLSGAVFVLVIVLLASLSIVMQAQAQERSVFVTATGDAEQVAPGEKLTYTLTVRNDSKSRIEQAAVSIALSRFLAPVEIMPEGGVPNRQARTITWTQDLDAQSEHVFRVRTQVAENVPAGTDIIISARVSAGDAVEIQTTDSTKVVAPVTPSAQTGPSTNLLMAFAAGLTTAGAAGLWRICTLSH